MIILKLLKKMLTAFSIISGAALLTGILCVYINPGKVTFPAFFGLAYPLLYVLNMIMAVVALVNRKRWVLFHVLLLLAGYPRIADFINLLPAPERTDSRSIKVMSYNVRGFNRYNWIKDDTVQEKIEKFIRDEAPDIICFQEFHLPGRDDLSAIREFARRIGMQHYTFNDYKASNDISGLVIFSRYPVKAITRENFHGEIFGGNGVLAADIEINSIPLRLINMHLESIRFERPDYEYAEDPTNENYEFKIRGLRILERINKAYKLRGDQVKKVVEEIERSEYPVILAGDANDPPVSYSYYKLTRHLHDSFDQSGIGTGGTYAGRLPSFRIDYVMHSAEIKTLQHRVVRADLSDHYPVVTQLTLTN